MGKSELHLKYAIGWARVTIGFDGLFRCWRDAHQRAGSHRCALSGCGQTGSRYACSRAFDLLWPSEPPNRRSNDQDGEQNNETPFVPSSSRRGMDQSERPHASIKHGTFDLPKAELRGTNTACQSLPNAQ